jgi:hypothetical protein
MADKKKPFTKEEVDNLNRFQRSGMFHPFTCDRASPKCETKGEPRRDGVLLATPDGWICPCGEYKQDWAHDFMTKDLKDLNRPFDSNI